MTQVGCPCGCPQHVVSNFYDKLLAGIGHRGSSFTDMDALVDDGRSGRQLMLEFKESGEILSDGQKIALVNFSRREGRESWLLRRTEDGRFRVTIWQYGRLVFDETGTVSGVRELFSSWWQGCTQIPVGAS